MVKTLAKSIREYKTPSILSPIFVSIEVILECLMPLVIMKFISEIEKSAVLRMSTIWYYGGILIGMAVLSLITGMLSGRFAARASAGFAKNLRKDMYYAIQDYSFANIDKFSTSSLVTRQTTDVTNVQMAYMMIIRVAIRCPFMLIFSLVAAFIVNPTISWVFLALVPVLAAVLVFVIFKTHPIFEKVFHKYDNMNRSVREDIKGIRVVKSFVREDFEKKKFEAASEDVCKDFTLAERIMAINGPVMQFCIWLSFLLIFLLAAILTHKGTDVLSDQLTVLIMYASQILSAVMQLSMVIVMIIIARTSGERIVAVLNEKSNIVSPENAVKEVKDGDIVFENVSFKYAASAEKFALSGINLHIKSGQTIGILGGTGASKSTLVNLIPRLYDTTEGAVYVGGVNVKDYDLEALRNKVAMVLQKNVLFSGTVKDNLRWGKEDATDDEMLRVCKLACADDFIQAFPDKYDTFIEQGGTNVSGGQKQRLCIARALLKDPKVLILDDSTSAVDTKTDAMIRKSFRDEIPNVTKIIIAQRVSSVQDADQIIVMDGGRINAIGTHEELLATNEIYQEVYYSQNKIGNANAVEGQKGGAANE
ncbi:MAG TPA: ABC transporter ATP-binding protein/permease [Candidatus Borkfalkia excrementavium]|uniref:ABC transporter ATP-binding protein/permease n=1 Tax=Candidatus Borkfalkia excrementavium TaxID=2838505 RepID=A0A9D1Z8F5_9FIRM|nr:ABC transporter ATP-binding protein/permease [Candidatus Borkfalkia excrementavium]